MVCVSPFAHIELRSPTRKRGPLMSVMKRVTQRASQACIKCRKSKLKCERDSGSRVCRRCLLTSSSCSHKNQCVVTSAPTKQVYQRYTSTNLHTRPEKELQSVSMDLSYSVSGLLEAFSNAEDVDWLNASGGNQGKSFAKRDLNLIHVHSS